MNILTKLVTHKKIVENYFLMTVLLALNSMFYVLIYPYLIRVLGIHSYGFYIFSMSIINYFVYFISYGFELPAMKLVAQDPDNSSKRIDVLSMVFTARIYLQILATVIFLILLVSIPFLRKNYILFLICFTQTLSSIFYPKFYFEGLQKMRAVTIIQLFFKLITLPLIFLLVKSPGDINIFASIMSFGVVGGALGASAIIFYEEKTLIRWISFPKIINWYKTAFPFFLSQSTGILKDQSVFLIIGTFFGMKDVAYYDLANKLVIVPRTLILSVNNALFPKIIKETTNIAQIKKIIKYEYIVGIFLLLIIVLLGKPAVIFLGGKSMIISYYLAVILSVTIIAYLVVGAYINFVFIPNDKFYFVTKNQLIALFSFIILCFFGLLFFKNIYVLVVAMAGSAIFEIIFCVYLIRKNKLL